MASTISFCFFFLMLLTTMRAPWASGKGMTLKLHHRFSLPMFSNERFQDLLEKNRKSYMESKANAHLPLFQPSSEHLYFVNVSIGEPPVRGQYMAIDTGSYVVWVIGDSEHKSYPPYDPTKSLSYLPLHCESPECSLCSRFSCTEDRLCGFHNSYGSGEASRGYMGLDKFVLETKDLGDVVFEKVLFGNNATSLDILFNGPHFYGLLALGPVNSSFCRNLDYKRFSYAIGDIKDHSSTMAYLELGLVDEGENHPIHTTPLHYQDDIFYKLNVSYITLGEDCLNIDYSEVFRSDPNDYYTGVIIDNGSILSHLTDKAYKVVTQEVGRVMTEKGFGEPINVQAGYLCYNGVVPQNFDFPKLVIVFDGGVEMILDKRHLFYEYENPTRFCLSFVKSSDRMTVLGLMAQQFQIFQFNLEQQWLSIEPAEQQNI